jgi:TetR/AcrR family transcriptional repressor of nem operon
MTEIPFCASAATFGDPCRNQNGEIRPRVDAEKLATLIISSLEGAIMVYRLERNEEALRTVQAHLDSYLETEVRLPAK